MCGGACLAAGPSVAVKARWVVWLPRAVSARSAPHWVCALSSKLTLPPPPPLKPDGSNEVVMSLHASPQGSEPGGVYVRSLHAWGVQRVTSPNNLKTLLEGCPQREAVFPAERAQVLF